MTTPATAPVPVRIGGPNRINHVFCCDPDTALCGADVSDDDIVDEADCIVCLDLEDEPCPTCGE